MTARNSSPGQAKDAIQEGIASPYRVHFCCPACRSGLTWEENRAACGQCGRQVAIRGGVPDFLGAESPHVEAIAGWSDSFLDRSKPILVALRQGQPVQGTPVAELCEAGLLTAEGRLTRFGSKVAYHLFQYRRQEANVGIGNWLGSAVHDPECRVLDLGCGAGQWMLSAAQGAAASFVGVDADLESVALGVRLARRDRTPLALACATAYRLPLPDCYFSHCVCRVAVNYMHQRRALAEVRRVLAPGGILYCRVEGPGHDLELLVRSCASRRLVGHLRDLGFGLVLALTGWQPTPGSALTGGRTFATLSRLRQSLGAGWEVLHTQVLGRFGGVPRSYEIVARKST